MSKQVHIDVHLEISLGLAGINSKTISVKEIILKAGQYSGLAVNLQQCIGSSGWKKLRIKLKRGNTPGWFIIENIF